MKIAISIDSACDMPKELIEKYNIYSIPYFVNMDEKEFRDGVDVTTNDLFNYVKEMGVLPKTGAPSAEQFSEYFDNILAENDAVIHISLSDKMTSACANAVNASQGKKVYVIDSKNLSSGIALLVLRAVKMVEDGMGPEDIVKNIEALRDKVQTSFLVDTLKFLYKGGRCSGLAMLGATLLMIKPKIAVIDGKMEVTKKFMGNINSTLPKYVENLLASNNPDKSIAFCTHSSDMKISEQICKQLRDFGFEQVYDCFASSTISSHCGPNTLGVLFINKD